MLQGTKRVGNTGPCGPCTEMFYDTGKPLCGPSCMPSCSCGKYFELWNDVFMEYNKTPSDCYELLKQKNVDTGMGVEHTAGFFVQVQMFHRQGNGGCGRAGRDSGQ